MRDPFVDFDPGALPAAARTLVLVLSAALIVGGVVFGFAAAGVA